MLDYESDREDVAQGDDRNENSHQACYVFEPFATDDLEAEQPPKKRRKSKQQPSEDVSPFPLLNHGAEPQEFARLRHDTFQKVWKRKETRIHGIIDQVDEDVLSKIGKFIQSPPQNEAGKLTVGLIVSGSDSGVQSRLIERWKGDQDDDPSEVIMELRANQCVNLQNTLKSIIKSTMSSKVGLDEYAKFLNKHKKLVPMNFDLELLRLFVQEQEVKSVVLSLLDVETFDIGILSELFSLLSSWSGSVQFVALLGIATTVSIFESRLSKSTIDLLHATTFQLQSSEVVLDRIHEDIQSDPDQVVEFGPSTLSALDELRQSQGVTIHSFTMVIKYAIMSHFFANSLSVLLSDSDSLLADESLCLAIRSTPSFQQYCEDLLATKPKANTQLVSDLLTNDEKLFQTTRDAITSTASNNPSTSTSSTPIFTLKEATTISSRHFMNPFTPRPRHALERALGRPADYLGCECCRNTKITTNANKSTNPSSSTSNQPPTSALYVLLQEAGTVINVRDLYDAFCARCFPHNSHDPNDPDSQVEEAEGDDGRANRTHLSTFYACLAELKMLGLVKSSTSAMVKKRALAASGGEVHGGAGVGMGRGGGRDRYGDVDFVAKTGWAGL